jgi:hypothetical protein
MTCASGKILNLNIDQGATFERTVVLKDNQGAPIDLTGAIVTSKMRPSFDSPTSYNFTCTLSPTPTDGTFTWIMSATNTAMISLSGGTEFVYDVEVLFPDTTVQRVLQGRVSVSPEVTK